VAVTNRRSFLRASLEASAFTIAARVDDGPMLDALDECSSPEIFSALKPLGSRVPPISSDEFHDRVLNAQKLMSGTNSSDSSPSRYDALFFAPGTSLYYFTGVRWQPSERLLAFVIPRTGQPLFVVPAFEEGRLREQLRYSAEIRTWQEDESPTNQVVAALTDRGIRTGRIGVEERVPFTFFTQLRQAAPGLEFIPADPVTINCRAHKSPHELKLMRLACEATFDVFRVAFGSLKLGMSQIQIGHLIQAGFSKMGLEGEALVLLGASAALPHGSKQPQQLKEGDVVLIDGGCTVEGYQSDVTRTGVLGKPSQKLVQTFGIVRKAQDAALDGARSGRRAGSVDGAARAVVTSASYGPDYKFFTHRVGHGIGLDGHEHPYLVRGNETILEAGMTFSNEPGIYVPGEFGLRCEDDMVVTTEGPADLLTQRFAASLERPFG
jgi:Xaa-Pro dipeptidase